MKRGKDIDPQCVWTARMIQRTIAKHALSGSATPREIVKTLIERVFVLPDKRIEVLWKFADLAKLNRQTATNRLPVQYVKNGLGFHKTSASIMQVLCQNGDKADFPPERVLHTVWFVL